MVLNISNLFTSNIEKKWFLHIGFKYLEIFYNIRDICIFRTLSKIIYCNIQDLRVRALVIIEKNLIYRIYAQYAREIERKSKGTHLVPHDDAFAIKTIDRSALNPNGKVSHYYLYTVDDFRRSNQLDLYSLAVPYS